MNQNDCIIRLERKEERGAAEQLVRESFWNVYRPGRLEHYVLHQMRGRSDFIPAPNFVLEKDGGSSGRMYSSAPRSKRTTADAFPSPRWGQFASPRSLSGRAGAKFFLTTRWKKPERMASKLFALIGIGFFIYEALTTISQGFHTVTLATLSFSPVVMGVVAGKYFRKARQRKMQKGSTATIPRLP